MNFATFLLLGAGLSMDALAIAVSAGVTTPHLKKSQALRMACYFGGFQALMPLLGYFLGSTVSEYIGAVDHWVAFGLLALIGIKMIVDALKKGEEKKYTNLFSHKVLLPLALATSIDALAVGVSLAVLNAFIWSAIAVIGCTTFGITYAGAVFGKRLGEKFEKWAAVVGGVVLVVIGIRILVEHLGG